VVVGVGGGDVVGVEGGVGGWGEGVELGEWGLVLVGVLLLLLGMGGGRGW
jgi:hypothetical protein